MEATNTKMSDDLKELANKLNELDAKLITLYNQKVDAYNQVRRTPSPQNAKEAMELYRQLSNFPSASKLLKQISDTIHNAELFFTAADI